MKRTSSVLIGLYKEFLKNENFIEAKLEDDKIITKSDAGEGIVTYRTPGKSIQDTILEYIGKYRVVSIIGNGDKVYHYTNSLIDIIEVESLQEIETSVKDTTVYGEDY